MDTLLSITYIFKSSIPENRQSFHFKNSQSFFKKWFFFENL